MSTLSHPLYTAINGDVIPREMTLRVTDAAAFEWRKDGDLEARPLADIREIRLWVVTRKIASTSGKAEIRFADGTRLRISSTTLNGAKDTVRDQSYRRLMRDLHDALTPEQMAHIVFRRGLANGSPAKGWTAFAVCAAVDVAVIAFIWVSMRDDAQWFVRPALVVFGLAGLVLAASVGQAMAGRTYNPAALPSDLFPS